MTLARTFSVAGCAVVVAVVLAHGSARQTPAQKMSREEIFEYQTKLEKPGSPEAGRPLYDKLCAACHRFGEIGKDLGPDLTTLSSRFKKRDVLEAILWPSKLISDQYQAEMFELADGKVVVGVIVRETAAAVAVRTADSPEKPVAIPKAQITTRAVSTVSVMPEALIDDRSQTEISDLLAFLLGKPPGQ
jgi:putative heme-binding domain-containing protein